MDAIVLSEFYNQMVQDLISELDLPSNFIHQNLSINTLSEALRELMDATNISEKMGMSYLPLNEPIAIIGMGCRFPGGAKKS